MNNLQLYSVIMNQNNKPFGAVKNDKSPTIIIINNYPPIKKPFWKTFFGDYNYIIFNYIVMFLMAFVGWCFFPSFKPMSFMLSFTLVMPVSYYIFSYRK